MMEGARIKPSRTFSSSFEANAVHPDFPPLYRLRLEQYHRMVEVGIIPSGAPVEMLEGLLVRKRSVTPSYSVTSALLHREISSIIPEGWFVSMRNPITLEQLVSEPEPDCMLVRGGPRDYPDHHPNPDDAPLVIAIADTSYTTDRQVKWRLYAAAAVPVYWILDLNRRRLEIHTDPAPEGYSACQVLGPEDEAPIVLNGREVGRLRVADILP